MKLHALTNPDSNLEEKMRFFADYFCFCNKFLGKLPCIRFDNPLSLADKMLFQIENNFDGCQNSIDSYLRLILHYEAEYLASSVVAYPQMKRDFIEPWQKFGDARSKRKWLRTNLLVVESIVAVRNELELKMFETMIGWLASNIVCSHPLSEHVKSIMFATEVTVSYFRLGGATEEEVSGYIMRI